MARSMLKEKNLDKIFCEEEVYTTVYLLSRIPKKEVKGMTPKQVWSGVKQSVDHFRVFGCVSYAHIPKENRSKLDDKGLKCIFIGYRTENKAYRLYDPIAKNIVISRDLVFNELVKYTKENETKGRKIIIDEIEEEEEDVPKSSSAREIKNQKYQRRIKNNYPSTLTLDSNFEKITTRSQEKVNFALMIQIIENNEPQTFEQAHEKEEWIEVMHNEIDTI